jgi:hypothetical protein
MTPKKKAAIQAARPGAASRTNSGRNYIIRPRVKAAIVRLALRGVLPVKLPEWLIHRGGLRHV